MTLLKSQIPNGGDGTAIHDDTQGEINSLTEKVSPSANDVIIIEDSASSYSKKKVKISNISSSSVDGYNVKVRTTDTTPGFLNDKLVAGAGVILSVQNPSSNETLKIDAYGIKVSSADTHIGFLDGKLVQGTNITLTKLGSGSNESLQISASGSASPLTTKGDLFGFSTVGARVPVGTDGQALVADSGQALGVKWSSVSSTDQLVKLTLSDTTSGYLRSKLLTGPGIKFTIGNPGGDETITLDSYGTLKNTISDTTFGYLSGKLTAGNGISLDIQSPGGNETLRVSSLGALRVSSSDISNGFLEGKLVAGSNISLVKLNSGSNESLKIVANSSGELLSSFVEEQFLTTGFENPGDTVYFNLSHNPLGSGSADTPSGYNILVYWQGTKMEYSSSPADQTQYYYDSLNNRIQILASGNIDEYEVVMIKSNYGALVDGYLKLPERVTDPTYEDGYGLVYVKKISGIEELFYMDSYGQPIQITSDGYLNTYNSLIGVGLFAQSGDPVKKPAKLHLYSKMVDGYSELFYMDNYSSHKITSKGTIVGTSSTSSFPSFSDTLDNSSLDPAWTTTTGNNGSGTWVETTYLTCNYNSTGNVALHPSYFSPPVCYRSISSVIINTALDVSCHLSNVIGSGADHGARIWVWTPSNINYTIGCGLIWQGATLKAMFQCGSDQSNNGPTVGVTSLWVRMIVTQQFTKYYYSTNAINNRPGDSLSDWTYNDMYLNNLNSSSVFGSFVAGLETYVLGTLNVSHGYYDFRFGEYTGF